MSDWGRFRSAMRRRIELDALLGIAVYERPAPPPEPAAPAVPAEPAVMAEGSMLPGAAPVEVSGVGLPVPDTIAGRAAALARIAQMADGCQACGLARTRNRVVFGVGNPDARLVVVGEAPGYHEDQQGEPFVGRAGQLLDRQLAAIHLSRQEVYIANTLKCRPPNNRDPKPDEKRTCNPWLARQIELIQPEVILAVGGHAARTLLGLDEGVPLGRLRGREHEYRGTTVMVTYHPAYLLRKERSDPSYRKAWDDLKQVRDLLGLKQPGDQD